MSKSADEAVVDLDSDSSWEDVEDVGGATCHSLLLNSLILEEIFDFLPVTDLLSTRLVCKEWNKTALLRKLLGSKYEITISKANFDRLLKTASSSPYPFCRKFDFRLVELELEKIVRFVKLFGDRLNSLSVKFCTSSTAKSVIEILHCPRLEELKIYGALPEIQEEDFHSFNFTRLRVLELCSSLDYGQVTESFIRILLKHAPNMHTVNIGQSIKLWTDLCRAVSLNTAKQLSHVSFSGIEGPLEVVHFDEFFTKRLTLKQVRFQNCLVRQDFLEQFLLQTFKHLTVLHIEGTQQEILSKAFRDVTLPNLKNLTMPLDGMSISEGCYILQSMPNLETLKIKGLFQTFFAFENGRLACVSMQEQSLPRLITSESIQQVIVQEKRREFLKVLSLIHLQPSTLEINLPDTFLSSRCLRAIYSQCPDLEELKLSSNSSKQTTVGLTGIPYRVFKRMAACKSFSVLNGNRVCSFQSITSLQKLKTLAVAVADGATTAESTLILVLYGISTLRNLKHLNLNGYAMSDVAFMTLAQKLTLTTCRVNGSEKHWTRFLSFYKNHTIKSFLLPPPAKGSCAAMPSESVGSDYKMLQNIFKNLRISDVFEARQVCKYWHAISHGYLHKFCSIAADQCVAENLELRLSRILQDKSSSPSPSKYGTNYFGEFQMPSFSNILNMWSSIKRETSLLFVSYGGSTLERFKFDNCRPARRTITCQQRRQLEYWYYPDGTDDLIYPPAGKNFDKDKVLKDVTTLLVIGCWGRKDTALLQFLNSTWSVSEIQLIGLQKDVLDMVLPKLTSMMNLESLNIKPRIASSAYCELTKTHLQILCNASFKLRQLTMEVHAPSECIVDFVRSQRFTLESLKLNSNVNISDRLTFAIPQLKVLQLDEPPGCLLWTTLNVHSSLETINFVRSGSASGQVKNKLTAKVNPVEADFEHPASEILCDINWFLENATSRGAGMQKSILQQGSDFALKFFTHFPFLSSLTLRSVHAHYGILQGIFKKFRQLKKLELINATGLTDEILTGFSKEILSEMDIMNPFQMARDTEHRHRTENQGKHRVSIRNLKCLTHLKLDDQPCCTDFSIIFGILRLHELESFSCKKWKITDVALRALADVLPSLKQIDTDGCAYVSKHALDYFNESRILASSEHKAL